MTPMQSENMAKLLESGKVMSCGSWLLIPHHAGVDQSYTALQAGSNEVLTFRNVNDATWKFQDAHSFEVIDNFQLPIKYDRDNFMQFFRSDEFHEKISVDDAHEVFCQVLHGSSDFSKELLESTASDYEVDLASVLGFAEEDYMMLASENKFFAQFLEDLGYTQDQISNIANSGINAKVGLTTTEEVSETALYINANKNALFTPEQTSALAQILVNTRDFCGNELGAAKQYCADERIDINSGIYREALVEADNIWAKARIDAGVIKSIASDAPAGATLADAVKAVSVAAQANKLSL